MATPWKFTVPAGGAKITVKDAKLNVPDNPILPFIEGDGTGPDIWTASVRVFDAAIAKAYGGKRSIHWMEVLAGEKAFNLTGEWMPSAQRWRPSASYIVGIKGPLTTPVGGGIRSLNVALRQELDLYACVRPVRWFKGVECPVKKPQKLNVVIFRENIEDVYSGIEWKAGSPEANKLIAFINSEMGKKIRAGQRRRHQAHQRVRHQAPGAPGHRVRPGQGRRNVTLVHKGNIMKFTEGAFRDWGYEVAVEEFRDKVVTGTRW